MLENAFVECLKILVGILISSVFRTCMYTYIYGMGEEVITKYHNSI